MSGMFDSQWFRKSDAVFTAEVLADAGAHAASEAPNEACGIVRAGRYVPCKNVSATPAETFEIAASTMGKAYKAGDLQGVIHSHPGGPWYPSEADMAGQMASGVPWAILVPGEESAALACHWGGARPKVFHDGLHVPRVFLHGVSDCYSLVQDYYREAHGLALADFPRKWNWWREPQEGQGLYLDNLEAQGFEVVTTDPDSFKTVAQAGDAYLMCIRSKVPNHAGIYLGDGLLLEHMHGALSHREPIERKLSHITHWLRPKG